MFEFVVESLLEIEYEFVVGFAFGVELVLFSILKSYFVLVWALR